MDYRIEISIMILNFLFNSENWIGNGKLIPAGPLREKISSLKKFDAIFLKHNEFNDDVINSIKNYNPKLEIFNTSYQIKNLNKFDFSKKYLIFQVLEIQIILEKFYKKINLILLMK